MPLFSVGIKAKRTDPRLLNAYIVHAETAVEAKKAVRYHLNAIGESSVCVLRVTPAEHLPLYVNVTVESAEPTTQFVQVTVNRAERLAS
jgi:hypothetical protein